MTKNIFKLILGGIILLCAAQVSAKESIEIIRDNYICYGTEWLNNIYTDALGGVHYRYLETINEDSELIGDLEYIKVEAEVEKGTTIRYIRIEDNRVYCLNEEGDPDSEFLLYDFSLQPGDECVIRAGGIFSEDDVIPQVRVVCREITTESVNGYNIYVNPIEPYTVENKVLVVSLYLPTDEGEEEYIGDIKWISGIGSQFGLLNNAGLSPITFNTGIQVYYYFVPVYSTHPLGITPLYDADRAVKSSREYKLDGSPANEGDQGIIIRNGRKIIR
ncbi:MAG: hypothetical protein HDS24_05900 [Bacteroides sp.]|nr:hypothetical protein [Bacteroides sp.]